MYYHYGPNTPSPIINSLAWVQVKHEQIFNGLHEIRGVGRCIEPVRPCKEDDVMDNIPVSLLLDGCISYLCLGTSLIYNSYYIAFLYYQGSGQKFHFFQKQIIVNMI